MSSQFIGTVDTGLFNLYLQEGHSIEGLAQNASNVIESADGSSVLLRLKRWKNTRTLEKNVIVCYGPEYEEDDGFGGSVTGPIPRGVNLASDVLRILQSKEA